MNENIHLLGGNSITTLIAFILIENCNKAQSEKTLDYAQQARKISAQKIQNAITRGGYLKLKDENRRLKKLCASHNLGLGGFVMIIIPLELDKYEEHYRVAVETEEIINNSVKHEVLTKRAEMLKGRYNQTEHLVVTN